MGVHGRAARLTTPTDPRQIPADQEADGQRPSHRVHRRQRSSSAAHRLRRHAQQQLVAYTAHVVHRQRLAQSLAGERHPRNRSQSGVRTQVPAVEPCARHAGKPAHGRAAVSDVQEVPLGPPSLPGRGAARR